MDNFYVYAHYFDENNLFYIGKGHDERAYDKDNRNKWWRNIVNRYGFKVVFIAQDLSEQESLELEMSLIKEYGRRDLGTGCLVNLTDGGEGKSGVVCSKETREKISKSNIGKTCGSEARKRMSDAGKGRVFTEEHKRKIGEANKRRVWKESSRKKMSNTRKGLSFSHKKVLCIETGEVFPSIKEAAAERQGIRPKISAVCKGKRNTAGGFHWKYID